MRRLLLAATACAAVVTIASPSFALKLDPLVVQLTPTGAGATQSYEITNDGDKPSAISLSTVRREMDTNGHEKLTKAGRELQLSATALTLQPGEKSVVRLHWADKAKPKAELAYRLIAEQRPLAGKPTGAPGKIEMNVIVRVQAAVYVTPENAVAKLTVASAKPIKRRGAAPQLAVVLKNSGQAHATFQEPAMTLRSRDGKSVNLSRESLAALATQTVLAGHQRRFLLPWPEGLAKGPLTGALTHG